MPRLRPLSLVGLVAVASLLTACGSGLREDPIMRLSADEALETGKELLENEKYVQARKYLLHAFEVEPNSVSGREGLLLAADALYMEGNATAYIEAETRYRDFINRFPTSDRAAYAQFRVASCLAHRMRRPDRDQTTARRALEEFMELKRLYPTSPYASESSEELREVLDNLATHELKVARFYMRYGLPSAAVERFNYLIDEFPDYSDMDKVLYHLCRTYERIEQPENAAETCNRLRREHPDSRFVDKLPRRQTKDEDVERTTPRLAADG